MYGFQHMVKFTFHFKEFDVRNKHHFYENYINDIEQRLLEDREKIEEAYELAKSTVESEEHEYAIDDHFQDLWQENYEFNPSLLYGSVFLSLYGFFEGTLKHCYEECVIPHGFGYPPISKTKKTVTDYKGFFNKYDLFDFSPYKDRFKFLDDCAVIRDKLIHTNGEMTELEIELIKPVLSKFNSISVRERAFGIVEKELVVQLNDTIKDILEPLCKHLYNTIEKYNDENK